MKKVFIILSLLLCEFCFAQEQKSAFLTFDDGVLYDESIIGQTVKQILSLESPNTTFKVYREENGYLDDNAKLLRMYQYLGEYRVEGGNMLVYIEGDKITRVNGKYYSSLESLQKGTELSETEIEAIARKELSASDPDYGFQYVQYDKEKVISKNYLNNEDATLHYAYVVNVFDKQISIDGLKVVMDESTGEVLYTEPLSRHDGPSAIDLPKQQIAISSNPVKDLLQLTLPTTNNEIKIFDMQGKKVLQTECGETANINVSMLPKGVYTLVVNGAESQKFVKE